MFQPTTRIAGFWELLKNHAICEPALRTIFRTIPGARILISQSAQTTLIQTRQKDTTIENMGVS